METPTKIYTMTTMQAPPFKPIPDALCDRIKVQATALAAAETPAAAQAALALIIWQCQDAQKLIPTETVTATNLDE